MLFKTSLSMSQTDPPFNLLNSSSGHVTRGDDMNNLNVAPFGQVVPDLPSWTPLGPLEANEGSSTSDPGVDELATKKATANLAMKRLARIATVENTVAAGQTLKPLPDAKPSGKKARFDGVLIATKPPFYRKDRSQTQPGPAPASSFQVFSLVDALSRTFDANRHTEDPLSRQSRAAPRQRDGASTGPQTDVETTEAEDEQLQLNTRLARVPLKRRRAPAGIIAASANASDTNSREASHLPRDTLRTVKRLKAIQYESNAALIDAALGTVEAPIGWDAETDFITRHEDFVTPAQITHIAPADAQMPVVDGGDLVASWSPGEGSVSSSGQTPAGNEWHMPTSGGPKRPLLSPYLSRGARFRQRLDTIFGENAIVRTDRLARPRLVSPCSARQMTLYTLR